MKTKEYKPVEELKGFISELAGEKYKLDCGHLVTIGHHLGNNIVILNGNEKSMKIICSLCH